MCADENYDEESMLEGVYAMVCVKVFVWMWLSPWLSAYTIKCTAINPQSEIMRQDGMEKPPRNMSEHDDVYIYI